MTALLRRAVVAGILLAGFFALLWTESAFIWAVVTGIVAVLAAGEWARLAGYTSGESAVFAFLLIPLALVVWFLMGNAPPARDAFFAASTAFWAAVVPWWLAREWSPSTFGKGVVGALMIVCAWLAALVLFQQNRPALAAALGAVWVADTAAYLVGRGFGAFHPSKLAPQLSPGKTWEGFLGGCCAVFIYALILAKWTDGWSLPVALIVTAGFAVATLALVGDLFESLAKRQAGVKDSGRMLGAHGGTLDRLDAVLPTLPFAALVSPWL